jgi:hypothetical protein
VVLPQVSAIGTRIDEEKGIPTLTWTLVKKLEYKLLDRVSKTLAKEKNFMSKVKCQKCDASILVATAERNNGLCARCSRTPSAVSPRKKAVVGIVVGIIFLMIGIGLGLFGHFGYKHLDHVKAHWTQATGKVTSTSSIANGSIANDSDRTFTIIKYSYTADGSEYTSEYTHENRHRNAIVGKGGRERDRIFYEKHRIGSAVKIYFNPDKHDESLLEVEVLYSPLARHLLLGGLGIFVTLALFRIMISVMSLTRRKTL